MYLKELALIKAKNLFRFITMEMLENSIKKYQNKTLTAGEIIEEFIDITNEFKSMDKEAQDVGLRDYEYTFCTATANNAAEAS